MKTVLLITDRSESYYYAKFLDACASLPLNCYILDIAGFPAETTIAIKLDSANWLTGVIDVFVWPLSSQKSIDVTSIDVAWYLRASKTQAPSFMSEIEKRFTQSEADAALRSLCSTLDCTWINRKETIELVESNKLYQQLVAQRSGLSTPETLITNNPNQLQAFAMERKKLLLKTIGYTYLDDAGRYAIYSQLFDQSEISSSSKAIRSCPVFSQHYIEKCFEYRVMAIGEKVLACRIDSQASVATRIDWRHYDFENVKHVSSDLPKSIQKAIMTFMNSVGLRYGAIDMVETPEGEFIFLEINPSGQWEWISRLAGLPIPEAVAEMLMSA